MRNQISIKSFQAALPAPPPNSIPFNVSKAVIPEKNPIEANEMNIKIGKNAYSYYCSFCHGEKGLGDGQVGQSYLPKPTDLTKPDIQKLSDSELYKKMLTGTGHEPVLENIIQKQYPWYIVLYIRSLTQNEK